jgi:hypothetical protein
MVQVTTPFTMEIADQKSPHFLIRMVKMQGELTDFDFGQN